MFGINNNKERDNGMCDTEELRDQLERLVEIKGIEDNEVLKLSQELDEFIVIQYKESLKYNFH